MIFNSLLRTRPQRTRPVYEAIVAAARRPIFYRDMAVPDTVDGRFDILILHLYLALERLKAADFEFRQELTDIFFKDMDRSLREMGAGDLSVGKKVRRMAEAFNGRVTAYEAAKGQQISVLKEALQRNVYRGEPADATALANWLEQTRKALAPQDVGKIQKGQISWP